MNQLKGDQEEINIFSPISSPSPDRQEASNNNKNQSLGSNLCGLNCCIERTDQNFKNFDVPMNPKHKIRLKAKTRFISNKSLYSSPQGIALKSSNTIDYTKLPQKTNKSLMAQNSPQNSASMVNQKTKNFLDINRKKVANNKAKIAKRGLYDYQKITSENYQREKKLQRDQNNLLAGSSIAKKIIQKNGANIQNLRKRSREISSGAHSKIDHHRGEKRRCSKEFSSNSSMRSRGKGIPDSSHQRLKSNLMNSLQEYISAPDKGFSSLIENGTQRQNRKFQSKKDQDLVTERLLKHKERIENKKKILETTQLCERTARQNLSSKISHKPQKSYTSRSNFNNFYRDQVNREMLRKLKLASKAEEKRRRELSFNKRPNISSKSRKISSSMGRKGNVHERLHQTSFERNESRGHHAMNSFNSRFSSEVPLTHRKGKQRFHSDEREGCTFQPQISKRTKRIRNSQSFGDRLLQDAYQRKDRKDFTRKQEIHKIKENQMLKHSSKSSQLAYKRFSKDFRKVIREKERIKHKMNFLDLCNLMIDLHMIDTKLLNTDKSEEERELIREIWRLLGGESDEDEIPTISVRNFICIILNFDQPFLYFPDLDSLDSSQFDQNTVGIISTEGIFFLRDKKEIKKIHKSFYVFCLNRFNNLSSQKSTRSNSCSSRGSCERKRDFTPKINTRSKIIDKRNNRSCNKRHNMLISAGAKYKKLKNQKALEKKSKELNGCTFFPDTEKSTKKFRSDASDTGHIKSSIMSDQSLTENMNSDIQRLTSQTNDKFLHELAGTSPINKAKPSKNVFKHKSLASFPYKPLAGLAAELPADTAHEDSPHGLKKHGISPIQEARKENDTDDEVIFKTNSTLEDHRAYNGMNLDMVNNNKTLLNDLEKSIKENSLEKISPIKITNRQGDVDDIDDVIDDGNEIKIIEDPLTDRYEQDDNYENTPSSTPSKQVSTFDNIQDGESQNVESKEPSSPSQAVTNSIVEQEEEELSEEDSQIPLLFVDVNLGKGVMKRIILYEEDDPLYIAEMFAKDNNLEPNMKAKLETLLKKQMDGVLSKIVEDDENEESTDN
ncbi:unnamed protein product [Moneuplotes crassus]|uniref:Uncharacterized protein n=1 Tax=Euplotes crassus TaxID=5936 RepID=A0AAD1XM25_EUPCR|nr:unnamed protein product [Moneuplotes crassus]